VNATTCENTQADVIIPTLNEAENIVVVIKGLKQIGCSNIVIVEGNSHDGTSEIAERLGAKILLQKGHGKGGALRQAFNDPSLTSAVVVILDADGSMNPQELPRFISAIKSGADIVKGSRFLPHAHSDDITMLRRIGNKILVWVFNNIWMTNYTDLCYGYMAFKKDALQKFSLHLSSQNFEIETEICIKAEQLGLRIVEIPSIEKLRQNGRSNLATFKDGFRILKLIIREFFTQINNRSNFDFINNV